MLQRYGLIHNSQCIIHNFVKMAQHFCKNGTKKACWIGASLFVASRRHAVTFRIYQMRT